MPAIPSSPTIPPHSVLSRSTTTHFFVIRSNEKTGDHVELGPRLTLPSRHRWLCRLRRRRSLRYRPASPGSCWLDDGQAPTTTFLLLDVCYPRSPALEPRLPSAVRDR